MSQQAVDWIGYDEPRVSRVLGMLDDVAQEWTVRCNIERIADQLADCPREKRTSRILAMIQLGYEEGYYAAFIAREDAA